MLALEKGALNFQKIKTSNYVRGREMDKWDDILWVLQHAILFHFLQFSSYQM